MVSPRSGQELLECTLALAGGLPDCDLAQLVHFCISHSKLPFGGKVVRLTKSSLVWYMECQPLSPMYPLLDLALPVRYML